MGIQSNVIPFADEAHMLRRARGAYVKSVIVDEHERSARFVATRIGLSPSSMGERLKGKSPFLADELESIARALRIDPVQFYSQYIVVDAQWSPDDSNRRTLVPKVAGSTPVGGTNVIPFPTRGRYSEPASGGRASAPVIPIRPSAEVGA